MLLAIELHPRQLQRAVEPQRLVQAPGLGEALLEVHMWRLGKRAGQAMALPFELKLCAIVVTQLAQPSRRE